MDSELTIKDFTKLSRIVQDAIVGLANGSEADCQKVLPSLLLFGPRGQWLFESVESELIGLHDDPAAIVTCRPWKSATVHVSAPTAHQVGGLLLDLFHDQIVGESPPEFRDLKVDVPKWIDEHAKALVAAWKRMDEHVDSPAVWEIASRINRERALLLLRNDGDESECEYLGLIVDHEARTVRRTGKRYEGLIVRLPPVPWHTFRVFLAARDEDAAIERWELNYPGEFSGRHQAVQELRTALMPLDVTVRPRGRRLIDSSGTSEKS